MTCQLEQEVKRGPGRPPKVDYEGSKELAKVEEQFKEKEENVKELSYGRMNLNRKDDVQPQTELSSSQIEKSNKIYLKPITSIGPSANPKTGVVEKFNEKFRSAYMFDKEYVNFIAEHKELIGEDIELWTKPYPGMNAELWRVPANKPVWGPRYLAEQIKRKFYRRLVMRENKIRASDQMGSYTGQIEVETTIPRLDCYPVSDRKSIFMGAI